MAESKISEKRLKKLWAEINMAEALNERAIRPTVDEAISRYMGTWKPSIGNNWSIVVNEIFPIVQFYLPNIFFRNPRAHLKPRNKFTMVSKRNPVTGKMEETQVNAQKSASTQEAIINYKINNEIRYKQEIRKVLLEALLFPHAVLWHGYKGDFGMIAEDSIYIKKEKTFVKRIPILNFIKDPSVSFEDTDQGMWVGRIEDIPLDDLMENKNLKVDKAVKGFDGFAQKILQTLGTGKSGGDKIPLSPLSSSAGAGFGKDFKHSTGIKFVRTYEVFVRPTRLEQDEGKTGHILFMNNEQLQPMRQRAWNIKAEGFPALVLQFNPIPRQMWGLSDINTYKTIADQKNAIFNLQLRNAQENSKVWVAIAKGDFDGEEDIEKIAVGEQTIILFPTDNINGKMQLLSPSGMGSSELYLIDQRIQRNLEDKSGVSELKKGFLQSGEESAESVRIRNAGSNARPAYRQDLMADFLKDSIHYLLQLEKQFLTIKDAVRIVGSLGLEWSEEFTKEDIQADVDVEIDVISMLPESPEKELSLLQQVLTLAITTIQDPAILNKIQTEGNTFNISPIIEQVLMRAKIKDPEIFRKIEPEESEGFVSKQQLQEAQENVFAVLQGQQPPNPPSIDDDHIVKLSIYNSMNQIMQQLGQKIELLEQLIAVQQAQLEEAQAKEGQVGAKVNLKPEPVRTI